MAASAVFPVPPHIMALLMADRYNDSGTLYSVEIVFRAVQWMHKVLLHEPYANNQPFYDFTNGVKKAIGASTKHTPIAKIEWVEAVITCALLITASLVEVRIGCLVALMYCTDSRAADILRLRVGCISETADAIKIWQIISKTDQYRSGHYNLIIKKHNAHCIAIINKWRTAMNVMNLSPSDTRHAGPFFVSVQYYNNNGQRQLKIGNEATPPVSASAMNVSFNNIKTKLGLPEDFTKHGIRVLATTLLIQAKVPWEQVKRAGFWTSNAIEMYNEPTEEEKLVPSQVTAAAMQHQVTSVVPTELPAGWRDLAPESQ